MIYRSKLSFFLFCLAIPFWAQSQENTSQNDSIYFTRGVVFVSVGAYLSDLGVLIPRVGYKWQKHSLFAGITFFPYPFPLELFFNTKYSYSFFSKYKSSFAVAYMLLYEFQGINLELSGDFAATPAIEYQRKLSERLSVNLLTGVTYYFELSTRRFPRLFATTVLDFTFNLSRKNPRKYEK